MLAPGGVLIPQGPPKAAVNDSTAPATAQRKGMEHETTCPRTAPHVSHRALHLW